MARKVAAARSVEGPWALPDGWRWERLPQAAAICDHLRRPINNTERLKRNEGKSSAELYPYYGATGQAGVIDGFLADGEYILLGEDGAPFLDPFKTKAYAVAGRFWVNNHAHVLMGKPHLDARLLLHWLNTIKYGPFVNGTTRLKLTQGAMKEMPVPVPPSDIQPRLVSRIDELLAEIDDGETALARARDDLTTWRKSLLKAAVTGELTADWRAANSPTETGEDLLAGILAQRRAKWATAPRNRGKRYASPASPMSYSGKLPTTWTTASMPQLGDFGRGKSKHRPRNDARLYGGPYPFVQTGVVSSSRGKITRHEQTYTEFGLAQSKLWPTNTLCITIAANIAKTGVLQFDACFPDSVVGLTCAAGVVPAYVELVIRTLQQGLEDDAPATAQKNINLETLETLPIPLPPSCEQAAIVAAFEEAEVAGDLLMRDDVDVAAATLRQSVLAAAFRGELA